VHDRLRRALTLLRERLDVEPAEAASRRDAAPGRSGRLALVALAEGLPGATSAAAVSSGGLLAMKLLLPAAALVLLGLGAAALLRGGGEARQHGEPPDLGARAASREGGAP
jgi:hypothetical protein